MNSGAKGQLKQAEIATTKRAHEASNDSHSKRPRWTDLETRNWARARRSQTGRNPQSIGYPFLTMPGAESHVQTSDFRGDEHKRSEAGDNLKSKRHTKETGKGSLPVTQA